MLHLITLAVLCVMLTAKANSTLIYKDMCDSNDANCAGNELSIYHSHGDKHTRLAEYFDVGEFHYQSSFGMPGALLTLNMSNVRVHHYGVENLDLKKLTQNFRRPRFIVNTLKKKILLSGEYSLTGKNLLIPMKAKGHFGWQIENVNLTRQFIAKTTTIDNVMHVEVKSDNFNLEIGGDLWSVSNIKVGNNFYRRLDGFRVFDQGFGSSILQQKEFQLFLEIIKRLPYHKIVIRRE